MRLAAAVGLFLTCGTPDAAVVEVRTPPVEPGYAPVVQINGLAEGQPVRLWTVRRFTKWQEANGKWIEVPVQLYAWADFVSVGGQVDTRTMPSLAGTYQGQDPYGLMWSGRSSDDPLVASAGMPTTVDTSPNDTLVVAKTGAMELGRGTLRMREPQGIRVVGMKEGGIAGVYAAPTDGKTYPIVLLLHGSEGGSREGARELALRYAAQGYAALSVIYFAYDLAGIKGVSHQHVNTPIEWLDTARHWVAKQTEADSSRIGVLRPLKGCGVRRGRCRPVSVDHRGRRMRSHRCCLGRLRLRRSAQSPGEQSGCTCQSFILELAGRTTALHQGPALRLAPTPGILQQHREVRALAARRPQTG